MPRTSCSTPSARSTWSAEPAANRFPQPRTAARVLTWGPVQGLARRPSRRAALVWLRCWCCAAATAAPDCGWLNAGGRQPIDDRHRPCGASLLPRCKRACPSQRWDQHPTQNIRTTAFADSAAVGNGAVMLEGGALRPTPKTAMFRNFYGVSLLNGCTPPVALSRWPVVGEMSALRPALTAETNDRASASSVDVRPSTSIARGRKTRVRPLSGR